MATKSDRNSLNVPGRYYIDASCIACGVCVSEAPKHFKMADDDSTALVFQQPVGADETASCENALSACPVQAIGNDG